MRVLPHDTRTFLPSGLFRNTLAPHCCDFQWLILAVKIHSCGTLTKRRLSEFSFTIHWPLQLQLDYVLVYGSLLFRLQLHMGTLQLDIFVYNCMWHHCSWTTFWATAPCILAYNGMWQRSSSQWSVHVFEETLPENCSGKPTQGVANGLKKKTT